MLLGKIAILLLLVAQSPNGADDPPTPAITLNLPTGNVPYNRLIRMSIDPIATSDKDPYNFIYYGIDWVVTEKALSDSPLENDLVIDSSGIKAYLPAGSRSTVVNVTVMLTFVYKDAATAKVSVRKKRISQNIQIGTTQPNPSPVPGPNPVPPPNPIPPPNPNPVPLNPFPVTATDMANWSQKQLASATTPITKAEATSLANAFRVASQMTKNGAYGPLTANDQATMQKVTDALAEGNRNALGGADSPTMQKWITGFLEPLRQKLNSIRGKVKTVNDQTTVFDEIASALEQFSGSAH